MRTSLLNSIDQSEIFSNAKKMQNSLTFEQKYEAIGKKSMLYEGVFVTAVTSTGIFCRPSCRARKPKAENVIFYDSPQQAIQHGFRPCKVCLPMEVGDQTPGYVKEIIQELQQDSFLKIKDYQLRQRGIEPAQIRRWFKKHHNMTFHSYQRMLRLNNAFNQIKAGNSVTDTAFGLGFQSLSGFNTGYRNIFGKSPSNSKEKKVINIVRFSTKLGPMFACATQQGLCLLEFTNRRMLETEFQELCTRLNAVILPGKNKYLDQVEAEVTEYFQGERRAFTLPLVTPGTDFQQSVWKLLVQIPYGSTCSYQQLSEKLGNSKAVRAVAGANGHNRISLIIPCHRIIASDGSLTGYGGGLQRKQWLIDFENSVNLKNYQQDRLS
jgi:AraC family transcriptional regulator of adaptative response/methylated-DNA-[protein]-cysteine methyltransferase